MLKVGDDFSHTFNVSKDIYSGFINIFKDKNPMHIDREFSAKYGYSDVVMHGNILNGFLSYFIGEKLPIKNVVILSQDIKYRNPFFLNDTLNFNSSIIEIYDSVNVVNFKYDFTNKENVIIAMGKIQIKLFK